MPVILQPTNRNQRRAHQRREAEQHTHVRRARTQAVRLTRQEERQPAQSREGETAVARGVGAPAVLKEVRGGFGADGDGHERARGSVGGGFAAREEVGAGPADGVFEYVGEEGGGEDAEGEAEEEDVREVRGARGWEEAA